MTTAVKLDLDSPKLAKTYDELSDSQFERGQILVDRLEISNTHTVLDIGSGTGRLGRWVLENRISAGRLIGLDPLEERVKIANEKNKFKNATYRVGKAEDLGFVSDNSVDVVYLSAVYHWISDKPRALREIFRVLKPGGKVGLTTGARELAEQQTTRRVLQKVLTNQKYQGRVQPDQFVTNVHGVTSTQLIEQFIKAGLSLISLEVHSNGRLQPNGAFIVDHLESSTFGNYLNHVPEDIQASVRKEFEEGLDQIAGKDGIDVKGYSILAIAEKPIA